nr:MAG TPA: hypothetical protein [Caudoviricetes sp.]DAJ07468.1 MAG TPA: hypothetical protein [Caudoviricetes sp.]
MSAILTKQSRDGERSPCSYFWYERKVIPSKSAVFC